MKICLCGVGVLLILLAAGVGQAELVHQHFETGPPGPLNTYAGWESSTTGVLMQAGAGYLSERGVVLPEYPGSSENHSAVYTNFHYTWSSSNHPVLRFSFDYYRESTNGDTAVYFGRPGDIKLIFGASAGILSFNGIVTGIKHPTGTYFPVTIYYDVPGNRASLDVNNTNIVSWTPLGSAALAEFNRCWFVMVQDPVLTEGETRFDNLVVDRLPPDTLAWWRFNDAPAEDISEYTGRFHPVIGTGYAYDWLPGFCDPLNVGHDVENPGALRYPLSDHTTNRFGPAMADEWTWESWLKIEPGGPTCTLMSWGTGLGFDSTDSFITVFWDRDTQRVGARLRDGQETTTSRHYLPEAGELPADGRWHHIAVQKVEEELVGYLDYEPVRTNLLNTRADGAYLMPTGNHCTVGISLNGASVANDHVILDEIRLTARALDQSEMLQCGQPVFLETARRSSGMWTTTVVTIPGTPLDCQSAEEPDDKPWDSSLSITAHSPVVEVELGPPNPGERSGVLRAHRPYVP